MPILKIVGYQTGFEKVTLTNLLCEALGLNETESKKMAEAIISGNVIALDIDDAEFVEGLAEELREIGASVKIENGETKSEDA